jgi:RNA-binding protein
MTSISLKTIKTSPCKQIVAVVRSGQINHQILNFPSHLEQRIVTDMPESTPDTTPKLTARQKQFLKGLAHPLKPLVLIGKEGMSVAIIDTVKAELYNHELIKVKIGNNSGLERHTTSQAITEQTESVMIQLIGKVFVLYKPNPEKSKDKKITLPKG